MEKYYNQIRKYRDMISKLERTKRDYIQEFWHIETDENMDSVCESLNKIINLNWCQLKHYLDKVKSSDMPKDIERMWNLLYSYSDHRDYRELD